MIQNILKIAAILSLISLEGCSEDTTLPANSLSDSKSETQSFSIRNSEIKQDIINGLIASDIEHWANKDGSIGFHSQDAEHVDAIGFAAIGAYAARN